MEPFIGQIIMFGGNFAPRGWALCDGQLLDIAQNSALFSILGTTYGGDGRVTFGLPDLRGRVAMHPGNGAGLTPRSLGEFGGAETTTLNINNLPAHNHGVAATTTTDVTIGCNNGQGTQPTPVDHVPAADTGGFTNDYHTAANAAMASGLATATSTTTVTENNVGSSTSFNNIQPFRTVNYIIALQGIFPSRN